MRLVDRHSSCTAMERTDLVQSDAPSMLIDGGGRRVQVPGRGAHKR